MQIGSCQSILVKLYILMAGRLVGQGTFGTHEVVCEGFMYLYTMLG